MTAEHTASRPTPRTDAHARPPDDDSSGVERAAGATERRPPTAPPPRLAARAPAVRSTPESSGVERAAGATERSPASAPPARLAARAPAVRSTPEADPLASAFDALVARAGRRLHGLALALTGDRAAAEDVVQEALARVWRRRHALGRPDALDGYVWQAVRHLAVSRRERIALEARMLALHPPARATATGEPAGPDPERVARALAALTDEQREVVLQRLYEDLPFKEIAARLRAPLGTIHSRYRLALERLRPLLESDRPSPSPETAR